MDYQELFDRGVDRAGTGCEKWDGRQSVFGRADVIPLWVADMDFPVPQAVIDALTARLAHPAFGYASTAPEDKAAVCDWQLRRHGIKIDPDWVSFSPGVVDSFNAAVAALAAPGELVAVQPPVYGPFYSAIEKNGCKIWRNRLIHDKQGWRMDLNDLEEGLKQGVKAVLLCSPHNPVGRVWRKDELEALVALTTQYGAKIICDEIHGDLVMPGNEHTNLLAIDPTAIVLVSATKTFNLAALRHSSVLIADEEMRRRFDRAAMERGIHGGSLFGGIAQTAAYNGGEAWLDALIAYLAETARQATQFIQAEMPSIGVSKLEGTYLMWLDMRALGLEHDDLVNKLIFEAGVGLSNGTFFGAEADRFMRLNIATPRANVMQALQNIKKAFFA